MRRKEGERKERNKKEEMKEEKKGVLAMKGGQKETRADPCENRSTWSEQRSVALPTLQTKDHSKSIQCEICRLAFQMLSALEAVTFTQVH